MATPRTISGLAALGAALGVSKNTAWQYTLHPDWPFGSSPWPASQVPRMLAWRDALPGRQQDGAGERATSRQRDLTEARIEKLQADTQAKRLETATKAKKFHNAEECLRRRVNALHAHKQELYAMVDGLPVDESTRDLVRDGIDRLLGHMNTTYASDPR